MRRLAILGWALLAVLAAAPPASAAADLRPCRSPEGVLCTTVTVPIDRSGGVPGSVPLRVQKLHGHAPGRRSKGTILALAGGPGQAATPFVEGFAALLEPVLDGRDLVTFDQRGTGASGLLRCPELERVLDPELSRRAPAELVSSVEACASELGPRRAFYTTRDSADDVEAVRRELGVDRLTLFGVSYGTKVALDYAARYPEHVDRLVLDSVVRPEGPDPLARDSITASARVLRELCRPGCEGMSTDPAEDLAQLIARLGDGPLVGTRVGADGTARPAELKGNELLDFLYAGDFLPELRTLVPGAVRGALDGDLAPVLRLTGAGAHAPPEPPSAFSEALFAATLCEELPFPYRRRASADERLEQAGRRVEDMPAEDFFPFDRRTALDSGLVGLCAGWPKSGRPRPEASTAPLPALPTLVLSGESDLRTPLESAQRLAERIPGTALVAVPGFGHGVLGQGFEFCPEDALERFFSSGAASARCEVEDPLGPPPAPPPASLDRVAAAPGVAGPRGRTLTAAVRTVEDVFLAFFLTEPPDQPTDERDPFSLSGAGGGLRGGRFRITTVGEPGGRGRDSFEVRLSLDRVVYVPGVVVTGNLTVGDVDLIGRGRLRISGPAAADGLLTLRSDDSGYRVSGRLDGRRVRSLVRPESL